MGHRRTSSEGCPTITISQHSCAMLRLHSQEGVYLLTFAMNTVQFAHIIVDLELASGKMMVDHLSPLDQEQMQMTTMITS